MRPRKYYDWTIPRSVVTVVRAVCADYERRRIAIEKKVVDDRVREEYVRINNVIDAALDDVEIGIRFTLLEDVVSGKGYEGTIASPFLAKNSYYNRKRKLVHDIAVGLNLI